MSRDWLRHLLIIDSLNTPSNRYTLLCTSKITVYTCTEAGLMLMSRLSGYATVHTHNHLLLLTLYLIDSLLQIFFLSDHLCHPCTYILCDCLNRPPLLFQLIFPTPGSPGPLDLICDLYPELLQLVEYLDPVVSLDAAYLVLHGPETLYHLRPLLLLNLNLRLQYVYLVTQLLLLGLRLGQLSHLILYHTLLSLMLTLQELY
jgi:hypothetical protein